MATLGLFKTPPTLFSLAGPRAGRLPAARPTLAGKAGWAVSGEPRGRRGAGRGLSSHPRAPTSHLFWKSPCPQRAPRRSRVLRAPLQPSPPLPDFRVGRRAPAVQERCAHLSGEGLTAFLAAPGSRVQGAGCGAGASGPKTFNSRP